MTEAKEIEIKEVKNVWIAWTNTDRTEGRGSEMPMAVCEIKATALRIGKGRYIQGSDCPVREGIALKICGEGWFIPGIINYPSKEDIKVQNKINEKLAAIEKAKAAGLTEDDLKLIIS